jgi:hypothetical protein
MVRVGCNFLLDVAWQWLFWKDTNSGLSLYVCRSCLFVPERLTRGMAATYDDCGRNAFGPNEARRQLFVM